MIGEFASVVFFILGVFLLLTGIVMVSDPKRMLTVLTRMGSTVRIHFTELSFRFLAGLALYASAGQTLYLRGFQIAGIFLMVTSLMIMCVPPKFHNAYAVWWANRIPPTAVRFLGFLPIVIGVWLMQLDEFA